MPEISQSAPPEPKERLDVYLVRRYPESSRSYLKRLILEGRVTVKGKHSDPGLRLSPSDEILVDFPLARHAEMRREYIPLAVIDEDEHLIVVNKPAGIVVHPAHGHPDGTLMNGLLYHFRGTTAFPFMVHRLDRETSGVMVVAKTELAKQFLSTQFQRRLVEKIYWALVAGAPRARTGVVNAPLGRSPEDRKRVEVLPAGREAETKFQVLKSFKGASLLEVRPKTGRTHQIRAHMRYLGHPILGDISYGGPANLAGIEISRPMLHAKILALLHPIRKIEMSWETPLPEDFQSVLAQLQ